jgi:nucleoid DNA-binding protein
VEFLIEIIKRSLKSGDDVLVSGFGKFSVRAKRERKGRNPATGSDMMLKPRRVARENRDAGKKVNLPPDHSVAVSLS